MKVLFCVIFVGVLVVTNAQQGHAKLVNRLTRQSGRYGGPNYRPNPSYNVRNGPNAGVNGVKASLAGPPRPLGVGAFSFGGMASGRPAYGPSFALNTGGPTVGRPQAVAAGVRSPAQPSNNAYRGGVVGRPSNVYQYNQ